MMIPEKKITANVDFYSASPYHVPGIPVDVYPLVFAVSRVSGWVAHVLEQAHPATRRIRRPHRSEIRLHRPAVRRRASNAHAGPSASGSGSFPFEDHGFSHFEIDRD